MRSTGGCSRRWRRRFLGLALAVASLTRGVGSAHGQGSPGSRVIGTVYDSIARHALAGVVVQLVSSRDPNIVVSTRTDPDGRFSLDGMTPGAYIIGALHPRFDSLLIRPPVREVSVRGGRTTETALALPSLRTVRRAFCGGSVRDSATSVVIGRLRHATGARGPLRGRVRASWSEFVIDEKGAHPSVVEVDAESDADGAFALCGLPTAGTVAMQAWTGNDSTLAIDVTLPDDPVARRDLSIGVGATAAAGVLRGTVRDVVGAPVPRARVTLRGSGVEATADANGAFTMRGLALGTGTLEAQAIGYTPRRTPVDVTDDPVPELVEVRLEPLGREIDTVRVRATMPSIGDRWIAGFEERRKMGFGHFLDESTVARLNPLSTTSLLALVPGISLRPDPKRPTRYLSRVPRYDTIGLPCKPTFYVDGVALGEIDIDDVVSANEVRAMEVYVSAASRPMQFGLGGCATIVIWRGMRKP